MTMEHDHSSGPGMSMMAVVAILAVAVVAFLAVSLMNQEGGGDGGDGNPIPTILPSVVPGNTTQPYGVSSQGWILRWQTSPTAV